MNVICSICSDQLIQSDDIFYTRCGHVFHLHCLTSWLERSKSCPQCREKVTQSKIHRLYFTFSSNDLIVETQGSTLQEKVDRLKFQILLKEKDIQYYSSKNVTLEKQNAGLKQEVRKVESEINKKNAAIHALKEQINYFKKQSSHCDNLKREISQLKNKIEDLRPIQVLLHAPISDVSKMVGKTKDPQTLTMYISIMKKELIGRFNKCKQLRMSVKKLQEELSKVNTKSNTSLEQSKRMDLEEKLAFSESKNIALQRRVNELEEILDINEQSNSKLEIQIAEDVNNISIKNPIETSKKHSQDISNKNSISNCTTKQKTEKICNAKTIQQKIQDCQTDNDTSDLELDLIDCNSSKNYSVESKRFKLSEDDINVSHTSHNNKSSNSSISKKRKKNNTKKKISDIEDNSSVIDLT
ncbi:E3 ubiquitin-protein ligase TRAIP-like isoform X1 [Bombus bifarius]|uniref:E3 ubiquitin-protein ligase TRAIP-like isoform X1 n=1 Tax=Bombus bifarius TaxID=103933 RepID=A0A6P8NL80_9HYME|nr:E3 ubiquitin-protein ligase TRAIP-like isoform X1 [Bombus vancouverensis nearcticus]XP_033206156.1 E3 ubiquitin-protein ligase TRAIP-like isoform X1 [Bombus vancouverensis nearcticus]XP_033206157.1 E3 ubiquitin-protein ligase TRAIP-like isoform X1 [Bombus vancouverensis nearcticus]XP_033206159.1 E3 ubiquitin-protein ligase TRAIP-like isoform X1 [Bombus vancouverensis nearcticus]XP_033206160.1 E3 ubiquitin-protein ligase TRAIP-like isoform X1 [Bombus vancouverensis nearcticus]XP_033206161.1 